MRDGNSSWIVVTLVTPGETSSISQVRRDGASRRDVLVPASVEGLDQPAWGIGLEDHPEDGVVAGDGVAVRWTPACHSDSTVLP